MKKVFLFSLAALMFSCQGYDDIYQYKEQDEQDYGIASVNWTAAADSSTSALIKHFWDPNVDYFYYENDRPELGAMYNYWPQAHGMDVIIDAYLRTGKSEYKAYFDKWYTGVKGMNGGTYINHFYDDMEWIAITMLRMHEATKDVKYLNTAKELWTDILTGWNDQAYGGIAWNKGDLHSKNACSNGPASIIAIKLYNITKEQQYKDWAIKIYNWQRDLLFNPVTGAVYDNYNAQTGGLNKVTLTYNSGTFLGTATGLYNITGEKSYLQDAVKAANYTIKKDVSNGILRDEGAGDGGLFKGIFVRYFAELIQVKDLDSETKIKYTQFLQRNAQTLWTKGTYKKSLLFGTNWATAGLNTQLTSQSSGCMLIEAQALINKLETGK